MSRLKRGSWRALRLRNARLLTAGSLVSVTGTWLQLVAQNWLVLRITGSAAAVGATVALQALPAAGLSLGGGVIADRFPRRRVLLVTQTALAVFATVLAVLCATGQVRLWSVMVLSLATGAILAVDAPTMTAFSAEVVDRDDLPHMIALGGAVTAVGRVLGMALAGIVVGIGGAATAFECNALSFIAVIAALCMMRPAELHIVAPVTRARGQVREVFRIITGRRELLTTVLLASVLSCFARNYQVTMAAMVIGPLHAGAGAYGTCSAAFAIGGFLGAAGAAAIGPPSVRRLFVVAGIAGGLQIAAGVTPNLPSFVAVLLPIAVGAVVIDTMVASTVQLASPGEARGRAAAIVGLAGLGGSTVGAVLLGFLADHFGARVPLVAGGIVVLVAVVLAMAMRSRDETTVEATAPAELVAIAA